MKRFDFSLQQVLKVKKIREIERQKDLADATQQFNLEMSLLQQMLIEEINAFGTVHELTDANLSPVVINTIYKNISGRQTIRQLQKEKVLKTQTVVNQKRQDLLAATRDKKILERLKEKQYDEYVQNIETEEQKFIDEIAVTTRYYNEMQD